MSALSVQVTYHKGRPFAAYIYFARHSGDKSAVTEEITPDILVDYASDGRPIGIEIVTPEAVDSRDVYAVFDRLGLGRPSAAELEPLPAA